MPNTGGNTYLRVKNKGDQINFRIAQPPVYTGKHFAKLTDEDGSIKWNVTDCPRINDGEECSLCEEFFKLKAQAKKIKDTDKKEFDKLENQARNVSVAIQFFFPVVDRKTETFGILQTTKGVRDQINEAHESGVDVLEKEWVLRNTGKVGKELYYIAQVDSADTKDLTDKEVDEYLKAQQFDLSTVGNGAQDKDTQEE